MAEKITGKTVRDAKPRERPYEIRSSDPKGLLLRVQPSGVKTYIAELGRGKRRTIGSATILTLEQARVTARQWLADRDSGILPPAARGARKALTLAKFLDDEYIGWARGALKRGEANVAALKASFPAFLKLKLTEITPERVARWSASRAAAGLLPSTINRDVIRLKGVLTKAAELDKIGSSPLKGYKLARIDATGVVRYLSSAERERLHGALAKREGYIVPMVLTALGTGLRRGELTAITWADVDLNRKLLTVRAGYAKSRKARHVPLNSATAEILRAWSSLPRKEGEERIFPVDDPKKAWAALMTAAKIHNFRFHDMRHDFASRLAMAGVDLYTISELLGHADLTMTKRYAHLAPEHRAAAVEKLGR